MMEFKSALDIPAPYCSLFERFDCFNQVQSALFNDILHSNKSVVLSAPTGSGKTVAFELAIVRMLLEDKRRCNGISAKEVTTGCAEQMKSVEFKPKAVYVAPFKALCTEKFNEWEKRFCALGVSCVKITGDTDLAELLVVRAAQMIITTPEKWDILTRSAMTREYPELLNDVRLFMVDEVHLLNEDVRGPILEVVMSRMKRLRARLDGFEDNLRFIVASATIPNTEDFANWIGNDGGAGRERKDKDIADDVIQLVYTDSQRPVPLRRLVIGVQSNRTGFKFDISLNYRLVEIILKYSENKASLIFCNSRKSTEMAAAVINADKRIFPIDKHKKELLIKLSQSFSDAKLCKYIKNSIAFHHAGVSYQDRSLIEESFRNGLIMILLCTNTLAMGVNLPAHLVIIKSTQYYANGSLKEYAESTLLQMIGRAGRPQYDVNCTSVVLTQSKNVQKYSNLINGKIPIESHLHKHLTEHLNAEIAQQSIKNIKMAMEWLRSTYLYIRLIRNPTEYGLQKDASKETLDKYLEKQCLLHIDELEKIGLISKSFTGEINLHATAYGGIMATFGVSYNTLQMFQKANGVESLLDIVNLMIHCKELSQFCLRTNEKKELNELNKSIRFPIRKRITTCEEKISCIMQAILGNLEISLPCLSQESSKIIRISKRLANCLVECICVSEKQPNSFNLGCYKALLYAVTISKCFHAKLWENSKYVSKQLRKIGTVYSSALVNAGKTTLKSISETSAEWFEMILNESPPFGAEILENVNSFPAYLIHIKLKSIDQIQIYVEQTNNEYFSTGSGAVLIVGDSDNTLLLYVPNIETILLEYGLFDRTVLIPNKNVEKIFVHVVHTTLVGVDEHMSIVINETKISNNAELITQQLKSNKRKRSLVNCQKIDLEKFMFSKRKISQLNTKTIISENTIDISDERISDELNSLYITENDTNFETNADKITVGSAPSTDLVQAKLTKFYILKKCNAIHPKPYTKTKSVNNHAELVQNTVVNNKENIENLKPLEFSKCMDIENTQYTDKKLYQNMGLESLSDNTLLLENYNFKKSKYLSSSPLDLSVKRGNLVSKKNTTDKKVNEVLTKIEGKNKQILQVRNAYKHVRHPERETRKSTDILTNSTTRENKFRLQISRNISENSKNRLDNLAIREINNNVMSFVLNKKIKECPKPAYCSENNFENKTESNGDLMLKEEEIQLLVNDKALDQKYEELKVLYKQLSK